MTIDLDGERLDKETAAALAAGSARCHPASPENTSESPGRCGGCQRSRAAFRSGELSYSKVREVTRVVDLVNEARLCDLARATSASQVTAAEAA
jgi:hypothetical protein